MAHGGPGSAAVSAGSAATARAGAEVLAAGGNAVDAVLAATFAATVAEQAVSSLGGGGFLMVRRPDGEVHVRDSFVDTPGRGLPVEELDLHFLPMDVQYPSTVQTFHVGMGSVAVPGLLAGILAAHDEFARLPLETLVAPARRYAADGVVMEPAQGILTGLIRELVGLSPESRRLVQRDGRWLVAGDLIRNPDLARFLDLLADGTVASIESAPFAAPLLSAMRQGGLVTAADLDGYQVIHRDPVVAERAGHQFFTNPPPSFGGSIIADTLGAAPRVRPRRRARVDRARGDARRGHDPPAQRGDHTTDRDGHHARQRGRCRRDGRLHDHLQRGDVRVRGPGDGDPAEQHAGGGRPQPRRVPRDPTGPEDGLDDEPVDPRRAGRRGPGPGDRWVGADPLVDGRGADAHRRRRAVPCPRRVGRARPSR